MGSKFQYLFRGVAIIVSALAVCLNMFVPKIVQLYREKDDNVASDGRKPSVTSSRNSAGQSSSGTDTKTKNIRNVCMDIAEGLVYVRFGKSKLAMSLAAWRDMNLIIIPSMNVMALYPPDGRGDVG
ncbi:hypothetical protein HDU96_001726 [Phlyctochytrium bullatum]|nr:hypothetical protein HDU96_001726 [Phlyctochytrium bullatum]